MRTFGLNLEPVLLLVLFQIRKICTLFIMGYAHHLHRIGNLDPLLEDPTSCIPPSK